MIQAEPRFFSSLKKETKLEMCVAKWLTSRTPDLEVWVSSLTCRIVSLNKELYSTLSLFKKVANVSSVVFLCNSGFVLVWHQ